MTSVFRIIAVPGSYRLPWIAFNRRSVALLPLDRIFVRFLDSGIRFFFFIGPLRYLSIALLRICEHGQCNYHGRDGKSFHTLGHIFRGIGTKCLMPKTAGSRRRSHIAVPALDGLADHRCRDLVGDLDVPDFAFALRGEVGEQLWDDRHIAYLVAAYPEAVCD